MAYKLSPELAQASHNGPGLKPALEDTGGFFLRIYAGPVPATPGEALNTASSHTLLGITSVNGDGTTGMTFAAAIGAVLRKAAAEDWSGTFAFSGFGAASPSLLATFFRLAPKADTCLAVGTGPRLQGTITAIGGGGDMERANPTCDNGQPFALSEFVVRIGSLT